MRIQLNRPHIHEDAKREVLKVLDTGWIGLGPKVAEFENQVCDRIHCKYAVAFNSATAALHAAVRISNLPKGSHVITTPNTFVSTNHVLLYENLRPVFADIELHTGNIDTSSIENLLRHKPIMGDVSAIVAVHYAGQPVDLAGIYSLASFYGIPVIEDAAHAFGASYRDRFIGEKGTFVCFSFHAVKPLGIGDGGLLATDNKEVADMARKLRWLGVDRSTIDRSQGMYAWDYNVEMVGFKSHMNDIQAAIGIGQLANFDSDQRYKFNLVNRYVDRLDDAKNAETLVRFQDRVSANHLMVVLAKTEDIKKRIIEDLTHEGIETGCHYKPNTSYQMYRGCIQDNANINMSDFYSRAITVPLHTRMTISDVDEVCDIILRGESC